MNEAEREQRIRTVCLLVIAALAVAAALWWFRPVLMPFVLAVFFAVALTPLVDLQVRRFRMPHFLAVVTTLIVALLVLGGVGLLVSASVRQMAASADRYAEHFGQLAEDAAAWFRSATGAPAAPAGEPFNVPAERLGELLLRVADAVMTIVSNGLMMFIFLCFLLFGARTRSGPPGGLWGEIEPAIRKYLIVKILLSAATGILTGLFLWILGIELAMVFGLLAFLLNFIPSVGSITSVLLPLPVAIVDPETGWLTVLAVLILPGGVQLVIGNFIEPRMTGKSCQLHAITVLLALIFWGMLWGIVGMVLATPMTAVIRAMLSKNEITKPFADLMAGDGGAVLFGSEGRDA